MDSLQRVGGSLESHRRPSGRRAVLLPFEVDLCEQLGITADEYWDFVANTQDYVKARPEEYAHIPDVRNDPVTVAIVQIVVGIALTAISALLAPKPKQPQQKNKQLATLDIEGSQGRSRYTKSANFDSVQSLANLGEVIPLIFTDQGSRNGVPYGGIRIDTQLLFSQMITRGTTQTLMAVMMLGAGKLYQKPDYAGYAIGDLMLRDFSPVKNQLFSNLGNGRNNRLSSGDKYPGTLMEIDTDNSDPFSVYSAPIQAYRPDFSGTRTPSAKTSFGLFNPIPNGFRYLVPYELILVPSGDVKDNDLQDVAENAKTKRDKIMRYFGRCGGIVSVNNNQAVYYLSSERIDPNLFGDWGASDVLQAQDETRTTVDEILQEGQEYMLGNCRAHCVRRPAEQWTPDSKSLGQRYDYIFALDTSAPGSVGQPPVACSAGALDRMVTEFNDLDSRNEIEMGAPWARGCVQQLAVASLSNSRPCNATEIGIKSEVWRQCQNMSNFNAHPTYRVEDDSTTIRKYEEKNSNINLGTVTKYTRRFSFFKVFARPAGEDVWEDMDTNVVFAIMGVSPEYVFNTLYIEHPEGQHEFEIVPVPGSKFYRDASRSNRGFAVHLLDGRPLQEGARTGGVTSGGYRVSYTGKFQTLGLKQVTNFEWVFGTGRDFEDINEPDISRGSDVRINYRFEDFINASSQNPLGVCYSPLNAICDYFINNTDNSSHANGPEHQVVFCNEIITQDGSSSRPIPQYSGLALAGIKLRNAKEWTSFSSLSAYIKKGHVVPRLFARDNISTGATNLFPEIAHYLLTDRDFGAGQLIGAESVDSQAMTIAARFCEKNKFYWDGIVTEGQNLREFIFNNAAFMLLDFTIKGGQFALIPSVPYNNTNYAIRPDKKPDIKALFTDGNTRGLNVSFLTPEERQSFTGVCIFRRERPNGFPELRTMTVRLSDSQGGRDTDSIEKFDCSGFMTSEDHARTFLRYALKVRKEIDHAIKFETTPQSAMNLEPGEYFRVASKISHTSRFQSGSVDDKGWVNSSQNLVTGSVNVVYWKPGETTLRETTMNVVNSQTDNANLYGCLFSVVTNEQDARIYKCESLSYADDGLVEVSGSVAPLNRFGELLILEDLFDLTSSHFVEETF